MKLDKKDIELGRQILTEYEEGMIRAKDSGNKLDETRLNIAMDKLLENGYWAKVIGYVRDRIKIERDRGFEYPLADDGEAEQ